MPSSKSSVKSKPSAQIASTVGPQVSSTRDEQSAFSIMLGSVNSNDKKTANKKHTISGSYTKLDGVQKQNKKKQCWLASARRLALQRYSAC